MQKVVIYKNKVEIFHKFNGDPVFILLQSENISATNGHVVATFCMSGDNHLPILDLKVQGVW